MSYCRNCLSTQVRWVEELDPTAMYCTYSCQAKHYGYDLVGYKDDPETVALESAEGAVFTFPIATAKLMTTVKHLIEDVGVNEAIPLPFVDSETLTLIRQWSVAETPLPNETVTLFNMFIASIFLDYIELLAAVTPPLARRLLENEQLFRSVQPRLNSDWLLLLAASQYENTTQFEWLLTWIEDDPKFQKAKEQLIVIRDKFYNRVYQWAFDKQLQPQVVQLLIAMDPAARNNFAIVWATYSGHIEVVKLLLSLPPERRVDPAAQDNEAIILAARNGHIEVVKLLLSLPPERGVDPAAQNNAAIRLAARNGHIEVVKLLIEDGRADPATISRFYWRPEYDDALQQQQSAKRQRLRFPIGTYY